MCSLHIANRLVGSSVSVAKLERDTAIGKRHKLMSKADTEHRIFAEERLDRLNRLDTLRGVAGTVGKNYSVRRVSDYLVCRSRWRNHLYSTAKICKPIKA